MVYPACLQRYRMPPIRLGVTARSAYRFWRDLGYAIGALTARLLAAFVGFARTIAVIGLLTFAAGVVAAALMQEHPR